MHDRPCPPALAHASAGHPGTQTALKGEPAVVVTPGCITGPHIDEVFKSLGPLEGSLVRLELSGNCVGGTLVGSTCAFPNLTHLLLEDCDLMGPMGGVFYSLRSPGLVNLALSGNPGIKGLLDESLSALKQRSPALSSLKLANTGLSGAVSGDVVRSLCEIAEFDVRDNCFTNDRLDLSGTRLPEGVLEKALTQLGLQFCLTSLDLSSCRLNGSLNAGGWLRAFVIGCSSLRTLLLKDANLTGEVDAELFGILLTKGQFNLTGNCFAENSMLRYLTCHAHGDLRVRVVSSARGSPASTAPAGLWLDEGIPTEGGVDVTARTVCATLMSALSTQVRRRLCSMERSLRSRLPFRLRGRQQKWLPLTRCRLWLTRCSRTLVNLAAILHSCREVQVPLWKR